MWKFKLGRRGGKVWNLGVGIFFMALGTFLLVAPVTWGLADIRTVVVGVLCFAYGLYFLYWFFRL